MPMEKFSGVAQTPLRPGVPGILPGTLTCCGGKSTIVFRLSPATRSALCLLMSRCKYILTSLSLASEKSPSVEILDEV